MAIAKLPGTSEIGDYMKKLIKGQVKKHLGRGAKLGYPTANIDIPADAQEGVFVGYTTIFPERSRRPSIIFIGAPEMFGDEEKRLEAHILDFEGDLYGQEIVVEIIHKLRDNRKFSTQEELVAQMKEDERQASEFFAKKREGC